MSVRPTISSGGNIDSCIGSMGGNCSGLQRPERICKDTEWGWGKNAHIQVKLQVFLNRGDSFLG